MSPYGDDLDTGVLMHRPVPPHVCAPPLADHMMTPPHGPAAIPSRPEIVRLIQRGCTHYGWRDSLTPWGEPCPVHPLPKPTKVGTMAAEPVGSLWRCHDCGRVWIVRPYEPPRTRGGYYAGGPPQWYPATRFERRPLRVSRRGRLLAWLRRRT